VRFAFEVRHQPLVGEARYQRNHQDSGNRLREDQQEFH
jgi:hypothetical protein